MKVIFTRGALAQLDEIFAYIARDNPIAAEAVIKRIKEIAAELARFPNMGFATSVDGMRMLTIGRYAYLVFYTVVPHRNEVRIIRVRHAARQRT